MTCLKKKIVGAVKDSSAGFQCGLLYILFLNSNGTLKTYQTIGYPDLRKKEKFQKIK